MPRQQFNLASALSGFAIGCVVTMLATIAIVPDGNNGRSGSPMVIGGGQFAPGEVPDFDEELGEGEHFAMDAETGETFIVDDAGEVVRRPAGGGTTAGGGGDGGDGTTGREAGTAGGGVQIGGGAGNGGGGGGGGGGNDVDPADVECAPGRNGGATDTGVTGTEIKFGATVAEDGIAADFLGEVRQGMEAVRNKVNRAGGICGRQLNITYRNDAWDPNRGATFIQNLVEGEQVFALAVSPSSEGLNQASNQGYFQRRNVPVIGSDGLNATQFKDPMIWSVAAATTTTINIMVKNAFDRGAKNIGIVFGNTYRFGVEGAYAANEAYKKLSGGSNIPGYRDPLRGGAVCEGRFCGIPAGASSYGNAVSTFNNACGDCDYVILLLEPATAQQWMATPGARRPEQYSQGMGGPQPLFTHGFGRTCGDQCNGMWVWTGYNPPIEQYANQPAVAAYRADLEAQSGSADRYNQFTMGGYVGMQLLVKALEETGPALTRARLVETLNSMGPLETGLTAAPGLQWRPNQRYANHSAQAFRIESRRGFTGWSFAQRPTRDQWLGQHTG